MALQNPDPVIFISIKNQALMATIDQINHKFPKGIAVSTTEMQQNWQYKVKRLSRHYTTNWNELATIDPPLFLVQNTRLKTVIKLMIPA